MISYFAVFSLQNKESCSKIISRYFTLVTSGNHALTAEPTTFNIKKKKKFLRLKTAESIVKHKRRRA